MRVGVGNHPCHCKHIVEPLLVVGVVYKETRKELVFRKVLIFREESLFIQQLCTQRQGIFTATHDIGVVQQLADKGERITALLLAPASDRKLNDLLDKGKYRCVRHGESHCNVQMLEPVPVGNWRKGVDDRLKHCLVTKHNGCLNLLGSKVFIEPGREITCLNTVVACLHNSNVLLFGKTVERISLQGIWEAFQILAHKISGFVTRICSIVCVVVPIENSLFPFVYNVEHRSLNIVQGIEADKDIFAVFENDAVTVLYHIAVQHTFIGQILASQGLLETAVDGMEPLPQVNEVLLDITLLVNIEIREELFYRFCLFGGERAFSIAKFTQFLDVGKQFFGIDKMLVYVIEILYKNLAPIVELVERLNALLILFLAFAGTHWTHILLVELAHKQHWVTYGQTAVLLE